MKSQSIILCSILLLVALVWYCDAKRIEIRLKSGTNQNGKETIQVFDDERNTIHDVADTYSRFLGLGEYFKNVTHLTVKNRLGFQYQLEKTIRRAGIRNGQTLFINW